MLYFIFIIAAASGVDAVSQCLVCVPETTNETNCFDPKFYAVMQCAAAADYACVTVFSIGRGIRGCTAADGCPTSKYVDCCFTDLCNNENVTKAEQGVAPLPPYWANRLTTTTTTTGPLLVWDIPIAAFILFSIAAFIAAFGLCACCIYVTYPYWPMATWRYRAVSVLYNPPTVTFSAVKTG